MGLVTEHNNEIPQEPRSYWTFKDLLDGVIMKGRCIIITEELKKSELEQLHGNHTGIEETRLLVIM